MVNPDSFIFHSDFLYNVTEREGRSVTPGPMSPKTIATGIKPGNRVSVFIDDGTSIIGPGGPFSALFYSVQNGNLIADSQVGAGNNFVYKIYKDPTQYSLHSNDKIDKVIFRAESTIDMDGLFSKSVPHSYGKRMLITGMWRNLTGSNNQWMQIGQAGEPGSLRVDCTSSNIIFRYGGLNAYSTIEYKIIGVDVEVNNSDPYVFHSDRAVLSIPYTRTETIQTSSSLSGNQTKTTYSQWYDTGPGTLALSAWLTIDNTSLPTMLQEFSTGPSSVVTASAEVDNSNRVRIKMVETNFSGSYITITPKTISVRFDMYHIIRY